MNRLTKINILGAATQNCKCKEMCPDCTGFNNIVDRLYEYENTKLEPQEVVALKEENKLLKNGSMTIGLEKWRLEKKLLKQQITVLEKAIGLACVELHCENRVFAKCSNDCANCEKNKNTIKYYIQQARAVADKEDV